MKVKDLVAQLLLKDQEKEILVEADGLACDIREVEDAEWTNDDGHKVPIVMVHIREFEVL